ncbi:MAG: tetratricopeptide repeat protein [Simkaniaceae bacterium]
MTPLIQQSWKVPDPNLAGISPSEPSPEPYLEIDLQEKDPYTMGTFEELQIQRFRSNLDYYLCVIKEENRYYLFDADLFIYNCIKNHGKMIDNPLTREPIQNFYVYVSSPSQPTFRFFMDKQVLTEGHRMPIFYNNPDASIPDRRLYIESYAYNLKKKNQLDEAIPFYIMAAELGSPSAKINLAQIYSFQKNQERVLHYLSEYLKHDKDDMSVNGLLTCAKIFWEHQEQDLSLKAYVLGAEKESQIALAILISIFEEDHGQMEKDLSKAELWRKKLPEAWQKRPIVDYIQHLKSHHYTSTMTGYLKET